MKTTQIRRYEIQPGQMPGFVQWFESQVIDLRNHFGFNVEFYLASEGDEFLWAVSYPGSREAFLEVEGVYNQSAERAKVFESYPGTILEKHIGFQAAA
jgi:hypothetical protein